MFTYRLHTAAADDTGYRCLFSDLPFPVKQTRRQKCDVFILSSYRLQWST